MIGSVWVLIREHWESSDVMGVYSNKDKANEARAEKYNSEYAWEIEEWKIDA